MNTLRKYEIWRPCPIAQASRRVDQRSNRPLQSPFDAFPSTSASRWKPTANDVVSLWWMQSSGERGAARKRRIRRVRVMKQLGELAVWADGGSGRFLDAMVLWGDGATIARGLRVCLEAGANQVSNQAVHAEGDLEAQDRTLADL
jgi:hypothetical protein